MKKIPSVVLSVLMMISVLVFLPSCGLKKDTVPAVETEAETVYEKEGTDKSVEKTEAKSQTGKENADEKKTDAVDCKAIAAKYGTVSAYEFADFDGNGKKEAFAVITNADETVRCVIFIDSSGKSVTVEDKFGLTLYTSEEGNLRIHESKGFFWFDMGAGGSGWKTAVYSVKDGKPYKLDISDKLQGFYEDKDRIYTTEDEFSDRGHIYNSVELIYNSETQQFKKGGKIEVDN